MTQDILTKLYHKDSKKWNEYSKDIIPMWVADMDFKPCQKIKETLINQVENGTLCYKKSLIDNQISPIISWLKNQHHLIVSNKNIFQFSEVIPIFNLAMLSLLKENESYLVFTPTYAPMLKAQTNFNRKCIEIPLELSNQQYYFNREIAEQKITKTTKVLLFCNPHNPSGKVWTLKELKEIYNFAKDHNLIIVSDELWSDLVLEKEFHSFLSLKKNEEDNIIAFMGNGKTFNIAGIGCSYLITFNQLLYEKMIDRAYGLIPPPSIFHLIGLSSSYLYGKEWLAKTKEKLKSNLKIAEDFIKSEIKLLDFIHPEATYFLWINTKKTSLKDPFNFFLEKAKVATISGKDFGIQEDYQDFVRINLATEKEVIIEALRRIKKALLLK